MDMQWLDVSFAVSGLTVNALLPPLVAFAISFLSSMGGLSGAFLIMPFMVSGLGYAGPSASATNLTFNIVAIPSGVYRFMREGRVLWPVVWVTGAGTLPGLIGGYYLRVRLFADPVRFKVLVGAVLLLMGLKILRELMRPGNAVKGRRMAGGARIRTINSTARSVTFALGEQEYTFRTLPLFMLSLVVGVIGGIYGIGGGAIISPFLVAMAGLPVYAIAGATLMGTLLTSLVGVAVYTWMPAMAGAAEVATAPDWPLGLLFGLGGAAGIYLGARMQRHVPERLIKFILFAITSGIGIKYLFNLVYLLR